MDEGLNLIDTGECYGDSETLIGQAVKHRRSDYYLFTKCGHGKVAGYDRPDWEPSLLEETIDRSLAGYSGDHAAAKYAAQCGAFQSLQTSVSIADQEAIELTSDEYATIRLRWKERAQPDWRGLG